MRDRSSLRSLRLSRQTSFPSTKIVPWSGLISPMMVLSSTLLPVPEGPSSATVSPSRTSKSTPFSTTCLPNRFATPWSSIIGGASLVEQEAGEDGVEHQDEDRAGDHGRGGALPHPFGALLRVEAHEAGDDRDRAREEERLDDRVPRVPRTPVVLRAVDEVGVGDGEHRLDRDPPGQY